MHSLIDRKNKLIFIVIVFSLLFEISGIIFGFNLMLNSGPGEIVNKSNLGTKTVSKISTITSESHGTSFMSSEDVSKDLIRADYDVGIEHIWDIELEIQLKDHLPGFPVHLNITVRNYGIEDITSSFSIICNISDDGYPQYINKSEKIFPNCIGITVMKAQTSYNLSWNWTPPKPEDMPAGSKNDYSKKDVKFLAEFITVLDGDINSSNDQKSKEIVVIKPPYRVNVMRGWYVENGSKWEWIDREPYVFEYVKGEVNYFELKFTLENLGEPTFINYSVSSPTDWIAITPTRQFWPSKSNSYDPPKNLTLTVFPSTNLKYLPFGTDLIISLKATCESYPDIYDTTNFIIQIDYIPNPIIVKPTIPADKNRLLIKPGITFLNTTMYNMGNGPDNFEIRAYVGRFESETIDLRAIGWNALVHTGAYSRVLNRGDHWNITLKLNIPISETFYSQCPITISITSLKYPDHPDGMRNTTFFIFSDILKDINFIEPIPEKIQMLPNSEFIIELHIKNTGNIKDKSINFNISRKPELNWSVLIDTSDLPQDGLYRNSESVIQVIIKTPKFVLKGDYEINITVLSENELKDEVSVTIHVLRVIDIALDCDKKCKNGNITEKILYPLTIKNIGNANDTIDLEFELITSSMKQTEWNIEISEERIILLPLESKVIQLIISVPKNALADTNFTTLAIEGYKVIFRATSQNNTMKIAEQELEIRVNPIYDFNLSKQQDNIMLVYNYEEGSSDYSFKLTNNGNYVDWYNINCDTEHHWLILPFSQRRILPMATEILYVSFDSPSEIPAGKYEFVIECSSGNNPKLIRKLNLIVEILIFDIAVTEVRISNKSYNDTVIREGDNIELKIKVENIGDLDFTKDIFRKPLVVLLTEGSNYIGESNLTYLPSKLNSDNYSSWIKISWKVGKLKTYKLSISADPNEDLPDVNRKNNDLIFTKDVELKTQLNSEEETSNNISLISLIIIITFILIVIWFRIFLNKSKKKYSDNNWKNKPYEIPEKADFVKDPEKDFEEEPEDGVLAKPAERSKLHEERERFLGERLKLVNMKPVSSMKPVKTMKPIPTSKPLIDDNKKQNKE